MCSCFTERVSLWTEESFVAIALQYAFRLTLMGRVFDDESMNFVSALLMKLSEDFSGFRPVYVPPTHVRLDNGTKFVTFQAMMKKYNELCGTHALDAKGAKCAEKMRKGWLVQLEGVPHSQMASANGKDAYFVLPKCVVDQRDRLNLVVKKNIEARERRASSRSRSRSPGAGGAGGSASGRGQRDRTPPRRVDVGVQVGALPVRPNVPPPPPPPPIVATGGGAGGSGGLGEIFLWDTAVVMEGVANSNRVHALHMRFNGDAIRLAHTALTAVMQEQLLGDVHNQDGYYHMRFEDLPVHALLTPEHLEIIKAFSGAK